VGDWEAGNFRRAQSDPHPDSHSMPNLCRRNMDRLKAGDPSSQNLINHHIGGQRDCSPWLKDSPRSSLLNRPVIPVFSRRRTTRPSSAGDGTGMGSWGSATPSTGATMPTVLAHRARPPRLSCLPRVYSRLILLSACRDGGEPPFGRPGAWEDGRSRQRWGLSHVRSAGKATLRGVGRRKTAE